MWLPEISWAGVMKLADQKNREYFEVNGYTIRVLVEYLTWLGQIQE